VLVDALMAQRKRVKRLVLKQHVAVDRGHQRAGIGDQVIAIRRLLGQYCLSLGYRILFVFKGRAAMLIAPLAQHFMGYHYFCATILPMRLKC